MINPENHALSHSSQSSMDRFVSFLKRNEILPNDRTAEAVWPPFVRLDSPCSFYVPNKEDEEEKGKSDEEKARDASCPIHPRFRSLLSILHNKTLHAAIFVVVYKAYQDATAVTEKALQLTLNLLQMTLDTYSHRCASHTTSASSSIPALAIVPDQIYREW